MSPLRYIAMSLTGVACLLIIALTPAAHGRTWTNTDGQTLEAEFVRLSNRAAVLKAGERIVNAPLKRLSEEDNAWIDRLKQLMRSREWGKTEGVPEEGAKYEGRFDEVKNGKVRVRRGSLIELVPYEELSDDDWRYVAKVLTHLEQEMPEDLLALKPPPELTLADGIAPADAVERDWTDITGREISAGYLGVHKSYALLWMRDKEFKVPLARLSPEDRRWIASQSVSELTGSLELAMAALSQATAHAQSQGPPPPEVVEALQPSPPAEAEPAPPEPVQVAPVEPVKPLPPFIGNISELSEDEYDKRLDTAFAGLAEVDYDDPHGVAVCNHCEADFAIPEGFEAGRPCPFCGVRFDLGSVVVYDDAYYAVEGSSRPWYFSRWLRRLVITVVLAGIGVAVKMKNGGD